MNPDPVLYYLPSYYQKKIGAGTGSLTTQAVKRVRFQEDEVHANPRHHYYEDSDRKVYFTRKHPYGGYNFTDPARERYSSRSQSFRDYPANHH